MERLTTNSCYRYLAYAMSQRRRGVQVSVASRWMLGVAQMHLALGNLCTSHEHQERRYVPPLIRPSGTFSHGEKALTTPSLSHRERVARSAGRWVVTCAEV